MISALVFIVILGIVGLIIFWPLNEMEHAMTRAERINDLMGGPPVVRLPAPPDTNGPQIELLQDRVPIPGARAQLPADHPINSMISFFVSTEMKSANGIRVTYPDGEVEIRTITKVNLYGRTSISVPLMQLVSPAINARANQLLEETLGADQRRCLVKHGYFFAEGQSGRRYQISRDGYVDGYCVHPYIQKDGRTITRPYPGADNALTMKMWIEGNEIAFKSIAVPLR